MRTLHFGSLTPIYSLLLVASPGTSTFARYAAFSTVQLPFKGHAALLMQLHGMSVFSDGGCVT